ncbi:hypothetical protein AAC387_Pa07g3906 [Persea americana]
MPISPPVMPPSPRCGPPWWSGCCGHSCDPAFEQRGACISCCCLSFERLDEGLHRCVAPFKRSDAHLACCGRASERHWWVPFSRIDAEEWERTPCGFRQ